MVVRRLILFVIAALPLVGAAGAPAWAQTPAATTYHGEFTGVRYEKCAGGDPVVPTVTGTWNISKLGAAKASISINIFLDGRHHVSFGGTLPQITSGSSTVTVQTPTQAGPLTIDLTGSDLTYVIAPYNFNGLSCESVTYTGTLGR